MTGDDTIRRFAGELASADRVAELAERMFTAAVVLGELRVRHPDAGDLVDRALTALVGDES